jgi:hypothetical protein
MAVFVTAETATFAALYANQLLRLDPLRDWASGFLILLLGAYAVAGIPYLVLRALLVAVTGAFAWMFLTIEPFSAGAPSFRESMAEAIDLRLFFLFDGVQVLLLALGAELFLKLAARIVGRPRKAKPLPAKGGAF